MERNKADAPPDSKLEDLARDIVDASGQALTTNQGLRIQNDQDSLKSAQRGPSLLEDFHLREKITHFDHERIPERVVHARGAGAHGVFQAYEGAARFSKADFLRDPEARTPVFVRFSTVVGSRGSTDLARDVRGFAVKFYTQEGVFDLVGNNIPVFFIQDAMKFPDLVHAVKPEQDHEVPQASSAHDTFWDFISLMPESMHMIMWVMSDRAIPRSYRMMEGFGVHTFRMIDDAGTSRFVKFHWKPILGVHSVTWDEAQKISGKDPDFHRRDLWEAIQSGNFPQWELGVQVVEQEREHDFDFDLLDPTKIIPEELVPVERIGRLTLDRNPDNFFATTEQVAFHPGHIVPGIDFSNDSLLQGRLFSYTDTQLLRLGGPNFHEIPINRSLAPVRNNQREGHMRQAINPGKAAYEPNSIGGGCPYQASVQEGGFASFPERLDGGKVRARSEKFFDHFSQATLFWRSQSEPEKDHLVEALRFELGKVERSAIRERMVGLLTRVDAELARRVAEGLGLSSAPKVVLPLNHSVPADADPRRYEPRTPAPTLGRSEALSMEGTVKDTARTRKIAVLAADGADGAAMALFMGAVHEAGAVPKIVAPRLGPLTDSTGREWQVEQSLLTASSVVFDAVYVPGGPQSVAALKDERDALEFVTEAYRHCKAIAADGDGVALLRACPGVLETNGDGTSDPALIVETNGNGANLPERFLAAVAQHRNWTRVRRNRLTSPADGNESRGRLVLT
jgi:catalase